jgi:hypothetical protein
LLLLFYIIIKIIKTELINVTVCLKNFTGINNVSLYDERKTVHESGGVQGCMLVHFSSTVADYHNLGLQADVSHE